VRASERSIQRVIDKLRADPRALAATPLGFESRAGVQYFQRSDGRVARHPPTAPVNPGPGERVVTTRDADHAGAIGKSGWAIAAS
jgi:hypothetical protein